MRLVQNMVWAICWLLVTALISPIFSAWCPSPNRKFSRFLIRNWCLKSCWDALSAERWLSAQRERMFTTCYIGSAVDCILCCLPLLQFSCCDNPWLPGIIPSSISVLPFHFPSFPSSHVQLYSSPAILLRHLFRKKPTSERVRQRWAKRERIGPPASNTNRTVENTREWEKRMSASPAPACSLASLPSHFAVFCPSSDSSTLLRPGGHLPTSVLSLSALCPLSHRSSASPPFSQSFGRLSSAGYVASLAACVVLYVVDLCARGDFFRRFLHMIPHSLSHFFVLSAPLPKWDHWFLDGLDTSVSAGSKLIMGRVVNYTSTSSYSADNYKKQIK